MRRSSRVFVVRTSCVIALSAPVGVLAQLESGLFVATSCLAADSQCVITQWRGSFRRASACEEHASGVGGSWTAQGIAQCLV